jgi:hypothetical protein
MLPGVYILIKNTTEIKYSISITFAIDLICLLIQI